ncbi:hypothetical protein BC939DRAFT_470127 [Gamsiella multidivaricata]|uniref:uncharacterized protein n=1 Tax=Gamsiella multidivaricata TaxID=101098 RepID=UPI002220A18C|nr:uncharacterized protein BC939DRAFT_470127 [Gamsiella multidivaricata]KAG0355112.1 hypothetical protein BGZ54_001293 [Gamsiella multidivaricata]KAI7816169.1 hypothetical protein BC939DRAFT_470127 [Gamsiella multidivaricata]
MAPNFKVLIAGASFGGVTLAILLERANIAYEVFEASPGVSPIGGAVVLGPTVMPLLEQLGLLRKVQEISKPIKTMHLVQEGMKRIGEIDLSDHKEQTGYDSLVATRSELLAALTTQIPSHKIHFSKQIVSFSANKNEVVIRCADDTNYTGEILVGADGAFSRIRELLYRQVAKKGILPRNDALATAADAAVAMASTVHGIESDHEDTSAEGELLQGGHVSLVGVTQPLDAEMLPILQDADSRSDTVIGDHTPHSWSYFTVPGNRICWAVNMQLDDLTLQEQHVRTPPKSPPSPTPSSISSFSAFSTSSAESHLSPELGWETEELGTNKLGKLLRSEDCRSFQTPLGKTLGDLIDATPKENIARALTEQTLFETWHHGRTVLIGDACHRMLSNAAHQGAVNAIQDAVVLGNLIHDLPSASPGNLVEIFKDFQADRYPHIKAQMHMNIKVGKLMSAQSWTEALMRKFLVRYMSRIYQHFCDDKILADRPQATFLPLIDSRGHVHAHPQREHKVFGGDSG